MKLDRRVSATSATVRFPKQSRVVESPSGKTAQPTSVANVMAQRGPSAATQSQTAIASPTPSRAQRPSQPLAINGQSASYIPPSQQTPRSRPGAPGTLSGAPFEDRGQNLRPGMGRNTTGVMIVDDSAPNSPLGGVESPLAPPDDVVTLADIPHVIEAEEARKQHRSLPSQSTIPLMGELGPLEQLIVKHAALLALSRSPVKSEVDLDDLLEFIEIKKESFWNKLFNKKEKQKKGRYIFNYWILCMNVIIFSRCFRGAVGNSSRERSV